jgi:hypothetical protein
MKHPKKIIKKELCLPAFYIKLKGRDYIIIIGISL